jgi:hypothetical protein
MNDRPKKSWRELDQQRDKSRSSDGGPPKKLAEEDRQSKQHRAQLDALFAKGAVAELAEKMGLIKHTRSEPTPHKEAPAAPPPETKAAPVPENPKVTARKKLLEAVGRGEITRAFDKYQKAYGMPDDWELLELGLEHQKEETQSEVMVAIHALFDKKGPPRRSRGLASKLRFLEETAEDSEIRSAAATLRSKLG